MRATECPEPQAQVSMACLRRRTSTSWFLNCIHFRRDCNEPDEHRRLRAPPTVRLHASGRPGLRVAADWQLRAHRRRRGQGEEGLQHQRRSHDAHRQPGWCGRDHAGQLGPHRRRLARDQDHRSEPHHRRRARDQDRQSGLGSRRLSTPGRPQPVVINGWPTYKKCHPQPPPLCGVCFFEYFME